MKQKLSAPIVLAFGVIYLSWGTTYLAIKFGLDGMPPCLFGGTRLMLAGVILGLILWWRNYSLKLTGRELLLLLMTGCLFFMGGNGMLTYAELTVDSGMAAVLVAPTPIWLGMMEYWLPRGERLTWAGWLGLIVGLLGVLCLLAPNLDASAKTIAPGVWLAIGSSIVWAAGSLIVRHQLLKTCPFVSAAYQMFLGGFGLSLVGLTLGETQQIHAHSFTLGTVGAFFYLLIFGSLLGFVAYNYLLANVPAAMAGTYAYVNPAVAILVGAFILHEPLSLSMLGSMIIILVGVWLLRNGQKKTIAAPGDPPATGIVHRMAMNKEPLQPLSQYRGMSGSTCIDHASMPPVKE